MPAKDAAASGISKELHVKALTLCQEWDTTGDGSITLQELSKAVAAIFPSASPEDVNGIVSAVDLNGDGIIEYKEFLSWLAMPPKDRDCFEDQFKLFCEEGLPSSPSSPSSPEAAIGTAPYAVDMLTSFTHPLLHRIEIMDEKSAPSSLGSRVVLLTAAPGAGQRGTVGPNLAEPATLRRCADASFSLQVPPVVVRVDYKGSVEEGLLLALVEALARAYRAALEVFCSAQPSEAPPRDALLRLTPLPAADARGRQGREEQGACLAARGGGFDWIRGANDADARLRRLSAFFATQRAVWQSGYDVLGARGAMKSVALTSVHGLKGTRIFLSSGRPVRGAAPSPAAQVVEASEIRSLGSEYTVMGVAAALARTGKKVAAVSAASAYQLGGGAATGGMHALEEAWCVTSTLFSSLQTLEASSAEGRRQHIPSMACVVSPGVEIFRASTGNVYEFWPQPVRLCGVLSVAMFNRNPGMPDSPLDSPSDPAAYVAGTKAKLRAVLEASASLGAEVLVIPDVGCGVFRNEPRIVGGCLGSVIAAHGSHLQQVVLTGGSADFAQACKSAFRGQDPRPACHLGPACRLAATDAKHAARLSHASGTLPTALDALLAGLAEYQDAPTRPLCRYGAYCHIRAKDHLVRFAHPEAGGSADSDLLLGCFPGRERVATLLPLPPQPADTLEAPPTTVVAAAGRRPQSNPDMSYPATEVPLPPLPAARPTLVVGHGSASASASKPLCRYGRECYSKNPKHLEEFDHPRVTSGESPAEKKSSEDTQAIHVLLSMAKDGKYDAVFASLKGRPDLVNVRPENRMFTLLHYAAFQARKAEMERLISVGADVHARTKDGKSVVEILCEGQRANPPRSEEEVLYDRDCLGWLRGLQERSAADKAATSTSLAATEFGEVSVNDSSIKDLEGAYVELASPHNGCPAYQKKEGVSLFLYHSTRLDRGWVIEETMGTGEKPLAYLGSAFCGADPSATKLGEHWKVYTRSSTLGNYAVDRKMLVKRTRNGRLSA